MNNSQTALRSLLYFRFWASEEPNENILAEGTFVVCWIWFCPFFHNYQHINQSCKLRSQIGQ